MFNLSIFLFCVLICIFSSIVGWVNGRIVYPQVTQNSSVITTSFRINPNRSSPCGRGILFFACPKKRTKRKGSCVAETTPFDDLWNRRGKNSLRSNSLPLFSDFRARRTAQRRWHPSSPNIILWLNFALGGMSIDRFGGLGWVGLGWGHQSRAWPAP